MEKKNISLAPAKGGLIPNELPNLNCLAGVKTFIDPPPCSLPALANTKENHLIPSHCPCGKQPVSLRHKAHDLRICGTPQKEI